MENNGTSLSSLAERLKARTEQETREIESLTRQQFENLNRNLSESSKNALNTTESAILKSIADLESNITSRNQSLSQAFNRKYWLAWLLSGGVLLVTALTVWGLLILSRYQIAGLRQEVAALSARKETLEAESARIWGAFKGLEPYRAEGKDYLLTPEGWTIRAAGMLDKREAWIIVRK
jgi:cell division protein FtsB